MNLVCREGGFVVVDPDQTDLIDRKYYVVATGDHATLFKQFRAEPMELVPCSTDRSHSPIRIGSLPFTVIGRVVYVGSEL